MQLMGCCRISGTQNSSESQCLVPSIHPLGRVMSSQLKGNLSLQTDTVNESIGMPSGSNTAIKDSQKGISCALKCRV